MVILCLAMVLIFSAEQFLAHLVQKNSECYMFENNKTARNCHSNETMSTDIFHSKLNKHVNNTTLPSVFKLYSDKIKAKNSNSSGSGEINPKSRRVIGSDLTSNQVRTGYRLTTPEETPFVVLLYSGFEKKLANGVAAKKYLYSVGSIIHEQWVLTSASKLVIPYYKRTKVTVHAGVTNLAGVYEEELPPKEENGSQSVPADTIYYHPKFDVHKKTFPNKYDFALIKLKKAFTMTDTVRTIRLSPTGWTYKGFKKCQATGFGAVFGIGLGARSKDDFWRKTYELNVEIFEEPKHCRQLDNPFLLNQPADGYGLCKGDFGAVLICEGMIRGVFSDVLDRKVTDFCLNSSNENSDFKCGTVETISLFQDSCSFLTFLNTKVNLFHDGVVKDCSYPGDEVVNSTKPEANNGSSRTNCIITFQIKAIVLLFLPRVGFTLK